MKRQCLFQQTRLQLAAWYAGVMGCILGLCGFGVYQTVAHAYRETVDQALESVAIALQGSLVPILQHPKQLRQVAQQLSLKLCQPECSSHSALSTRQISIGVAPISYYLRLSRYPNVPVAIAGLSLDQLPLTSNKVRWLTLKTSSGESFRQVSLPLQAENQTWGYLQVGRSLIDLDQHLDALLFTMLMGFPVALVIIGGSSWWLAGLAMQPIYRSYQQMGQFTANAAHELRTPIAAMQATIEATLIQSSVDLPESSFIITLKRQTLRLSQLVKDLLLLARLEQQETVNYAACCLNDLVDDLIEELAFLSVAAQVTLKAQVQASEPVEVWGNAVQVYRLVSNLIDNAIRSTPAGGSVIVSLDQSENAAIVEVRDTGIGIAPEDQRYLFDRFYRVQPDRSLQTGGSGLGLPIAQGIVQAHQGSIEVQSQLGQGSRFIVRLPLFYP
ncbi:MAG TPA: two-component system sensor histidine kinase RppB [Leptolyngbya sp.]|nr:two-component system sensor histidine kinase RppB [Leptolyngbya sp.]